MQPKFTLAILSISLLLICSNALGQRPLSNSRQSSYYTYIYKLSDAEAERFYTEPNKPLNEGILQHPLDSFLTDKGTLPPLPPGNYLKVYALKNELKYSLVEKRTASLQMFVTRYEYRFTITDNGGKYIDNALVTINGHKVDHDAASATWHFRKAPKQVLLKVQYAGVANYFKLNKNEYYDGNVFKYRWQRFRRRVANIFRHKPAYSYRYNRNNGFMVFNKPIYKPGDTVKFKAFILNNKLKPISQQKLLVRLNDSGDKKTLGSVASYRPGAFEYSFVLTDSLDLDLDDTYKIELADPAKIKLDEDGEEDDDEDVQAQATLISGEFKYEEYELKSIQFDVRADKKEHYLGDPLAVYFKATDENGLPVPDGRVQLTLTKQGSSGYKSGYVFVPDTLWQHKFTLDAVGETKILIPDSIFPEANIDYQLDAHFLNADNQSSDKDIEASFNYSKYHVTTDLVNDSLKINHFYLGKSQTATAFVSALNAGGDTLSKVKIQLPGFVTVNPYASEYNIETDCTDTDIELKDFEGGISLSTDRSTDSVFVEVANPRKLHFFYSVFANNKLIDKGQAEKLYYRRAFGGDAPVIFVANYVWGGLIQKAEINSLFQKSKLNVNVRQPVSVYPGQKASTDIVVTDALGKPVAGADLTAWSITKKFKENGPYIPYLGKGARRPRTKPDYRLQYSEAGGSAILNWKRWSRELGLDSIEYYRFTHPQLVYRIEEPSKDTVTQIAPFALQNGDIEPVHILYIDHVPVYFSQAQQLQPYSFQVTPGYHHLLIRTAEKEVEIDSVLVKRATKMILSINADVYAPTKKPDTLSAFDAAMLNKYLVTMVNNFDGKPTTIEQPGRVFFLNPYNAAPNSLLVGPLANNYALFSQPGRNQIFMAEPSYNFLMEPGLIKQKSTPGRFPFHQYLRWGKGSSSYTDYVLTKTGVDSLWQDYLDKRSNTQALFINDPVAARATGELVISNLPVFKEEPVFIKNVILYRYDDPDFIRVSPGNTQQFGKLAAGNYRIFYLLKNDAYDIKEQVLVKAGGINHYNFVIKPAHKRDSVSIKISAIINNRHSNIYRNGDTGIENDALRLKEAFNNKYLNAQDFTGNIRGKVIGVRDKLALPGVSIRIKGTSVDTQSNINGEFALKGPNTGKLIINYVGFITQEINYKAGEPVNISLAESSRSLQEVVVVGYGTTKKSNLTASVSSVTYEGLLQGKVAGVQIVMDSTGAPGAAPQIRIRGNATSANQKLLIVIDGEIVENLNGIDPSTLGEVTILKDAAATAIYGSRAAQGVVIITRKQNNVATAAPASEAQTGENQQATLRKNFSDYAYWQPKLITDENGKASFTSVFPDDITNWRTFVVAINGQRQSGFSEKQIKSFKPLSANFIAPQFAVEGDEMKLIGKVMNYASARASVNRAFSYNGKILTQGLLEVTNSKIDTLGIIASATDSLAFEFSIKRDNGYFDGEQRKVPVMKQGIQETRGVFEALYRDTTVNLKFDPAMGPVTFRAEASALPALAEEAKRLREYKYLCNEQLASKLKGLLAEKRIKTFLGEDFKYERNINEVIKKLQQSRKPNGTWGWWANTNEELWISLHAVEALREAQKMGYIVQLDQQKLTDYLVYQMESYRGEDKLTCLQLLHQMAAKVDYPKYFGVIEAEYKKQKDVSTYARLKFMRLKQLTGQTVKTDSLIRVAHKTMFGNMYWGEENYRFFDNSIQLSVTAYNIIKAEGKHPDLLNKIRGYFLEQRKQGEWRNTYESALILETLLPDLLLKDKQIKPAVLTLKGSATETITQFPYTATLKDNAISVSKTGSLPVYITGYQQFWNSKPEKVSKDFTVNTWFERRGDKVTSLKGGEAVELQAEVTAKGDADFVIIEIPIPAGCSYESKNQQWSNNEVHREFLKEKVSIFCRKLKQGTYTFTVKLMPRYSGNYTLNPAKAEQMYFPVFYGREGMRKVVVQ